MFVTIRNLIQNTVRLLEIHENNCRRLKLYKSTQCLLIKNTNGEIILFSVKKSSKSIRPVYNMTAENVHKHVMHIILQEYVKCMGMFVAI